MKKTIHIYGTDQVTPIEIRESFVRDGVVRYKKKSYKIFDNKGIPSIKAHEPITHPLQRYDDDEIIRQAMNILTNRILKGPFLESPDAVKNLVLLRNKDLMREVFNIVFLDNRHRVVSFYDDSPFHVHTMGNVDSASVYPNIIIQEALRVGAKAMILIHNHPSAGCPNPSQSDRNITVAIQKTAKLFDIRVLDHLITAGNKTYSFAEQGDL